LISPTAYGEMLEVGIRMPAVGRSSLEFESEVRSVSDERAVARARSTQVLFDYATNNRVPIGDEWLARVEAGQGERPSPRG